MIASVSGVTFGLSEGLGFGLSDGPGFGLSAGLSIGLGAGLSTGLFYWILLGLLQGVSSERIEDRARHVPNQGIRHSLYNSMLMALISGGIIGVTATLIYVLDIGLLTRLSVGLLTRLNLGFSWPGTGWVLGLCGGLLVCAVNGGLAALRHGILRLLLQRAGVIPRHYVRFLDEAASCILLQKVGGGYSFVHRLLLDYFAALEKKDP